MFTDGIFCSSGYACEMKRDPPRGVQGHRPAELVSTQGAPPPEPPPPLPPDGHDPSPLVTALPAACISEMANTEDHDLSIKPWDSRWCSRTARGQQRANESFTIGNIPSSVRSSFADDRGSRQLRGGSLPCSPAALCNEDQLSGTTQGLYVPMQRGMAGYSCEAPAGRMPDRRGRNTEARDESVKMSFSPRALPSIIRAESPGRMIPACKYAAAPEDAVDEALALQCKVLPPHLARALHIRRIAPGEYEVDGNPITFGVVDSPDSGLEEVWAGSSDECLTEPLAAYLPRIAEIAHQRSPPDPPEAILPSFPWGGALSWLSSSNSTEALNLATPKVKTPQLISGPALQTQSRVDSRAMVGARTIPVSAPGSQTVRSIAPTVATSMPGSHVIPRRPSMVISKLVSQGPCGQSQGTIRPIVQSTMPMAHAIRTTIS